MCRDGASDRRNGFWKRDQALDRRYRTPDYRSINEQGRISISRSPRPCRAEHRTGPRRRCTTVVAPAWWTVYRLNRPVRVHHSTVKIFQTLTPRRRLPVPGVQLSVPTDSSEMSLKEGIAESLYGRGRLRESAETNYERFRNFTTRDFATSQAAGLGLSPPVAGTRFGCETRTSRPRAR